MAAWQRGLLATLALLALTQFAGLQDGLNRLITDAHSRWRVTQRKEPFPSDLLVIGIDDKSVGELGRLKYWSRAEYARLLKPLRLARVVGFDILFPDADQRDPAGDRAFARAVREHGRVVIPYFQYRETRPFSEATKREVATLLGRMPAARTELAGTLEPVPSSNLEPPLPELLQAAAALGYADVNADPDGVYRAPTMVKTSDRVPLAHFTVAMASVAAGTPLADALKPVPAALQLGNRSVPLSGGRLLLHSIARRGGGLAQGTGQPVPLMSFADALKTDPEQFRDKVVVVGETATGTTDIRANPLDPGLRGVELNAEILANLLHLQPYRPVPAGVQWLLILLAVGMPLWLYSAFTPGKASLGAALLLLGTAAIMEGGYWGANLVPSWAPVLVGLLGSTLSMGIMRATQEHEAKQHLHRHFSQYAPPKLVEDLVSNPDRAGEQGTRQRVALLFSDVRSFTTYSEQNPPELVVRQMREYLDEMAGSVDALDGVLDKFIGDAVMALFGPFLDEGENVSARAILCGLDMLQRLDKINARWADEDLPLFRIGIGVHVGDAVVGNIGTPRRQQFTALGDAVNLAARLESSTKDLKVALLVSETTMQEAEPLLRGVAVFRDRGTISVKGREQPVRVYEVRRSRPEPPGPEEGEAHGAASEEGLEADRR